MRRNGVRSFEKCSSESSRIERIPKQTLSDRNLKNRVESVAGRVIKTQKQT